MYKHTAHFPEPIDVGILESLEGLQIDNIWSHGGVVSWCSMEEFRIGAPRLAQLNPTITLAPDVSNFSIYFNYGNGNFRAKVENNKISSIFHESELQTPAELVAVEADGERLANALKERSRTLNNAKVELTGTETDSEVELF